MNDGSLRQELSSTGRRTSVCVLAVPKIAMSRIRPSTTAIRGVGPTIWMGLEGWGRDARLPSWSSPLFPPESAPDHLIPGSRRNERSLLLQHSNGMNKEAEAKWDAQSG